MGLGEVGCLSMEKTHLGTVAGHENGRRSPDKPKVPLSLGQVFGAEGERWAGRRPH